MAKGKDNKAIYRKSNCLSRKSENIYSLCRNKWSADIFRDITEVKQWESHIFTHLKLMAQRCVFLQQTEQFGSDMRWAKSMNRFMYIKNKKQPTVLSSLASRWCLSEKKSHFRLSVWMSGFGSSDWLQSQPHITGLKTLWTSWTTNSLLCAEIKESNNTSKEGYDLPHHYSNGFFNVNSLICVCKTLCIYLLTGWQPEH